MNNIYISTWRQLRRHINRFALVAASRARRKASRKSK